MELQLCWKKSDRNLVHDSSKILNEMEQETPQRLVEHTFQNFQIFRAYQDQVKSGTYTAMGYLASSFHTKMILSETQSPYIQQRLLFPGALVIPAELEETSKKKIRKCLH